MIKSIYSLQLIPDKSGKVTLQRKRLFEASITSIIPESEADKTIYYHDFKLFNFEVNGLNELDLQLSTRADNNISSRFLRKVLRNDNSISNEDIMNMLLYDSGEDMFRFLNEKEIVPYDDADFNIDVTAQLNSFLTNNKLGLVLTDKIPDEIKPFLITLMSSYYTQKLKDSMSQYKYDSNDRSFIRSIISDIVEFREELIPNGTAALEFEKYISLDNTISTIVDMTSTNKQLVVSITKNIAVTENWTPNEVVMELDTMNSYLDVLLRERIGTKTVDMRTIINPELTSVKVAGVDRAGIKNMIHYLSGRVISYDDMKDLDISHQAIPISYPFPEIANLYRIYKSAQFGSVIGLVCKEISFVPEGLKWSISSEGDSIKSLDITLDDLKLKFRGSFINDIFTSILTINDKPVENISTNVNSFQGLDLLSLF